MKTERIAVPSGWEEVSTPVYIIDVGRVEENLQIIHEVIKKTGCKVLLALKGFASWSLFPIIKKYLHGVAASSVFEARLGREEFGGEVHVYSPAYSQKDIEELILLADHIVFNSIHQFHQFRNFIRKHAPHISMGLRINPEYSEIQVPIYNPCRPHSRLGVRITQIHGQDLNGIEGLHFHALCEQGAETLERVLQVVEQRFASYLRGLKWFNFGGGHHISRPDYNIELLSSLIERFQSRYELTVYLEPGEAVVLNAGILVSSVLDIIENEIPIAILDTSAAAHMPDVLEMPYRPEIRGAGLPGEKKYTYILGGITCLAGDEIGTYSFDKPLKPGDKLVFEDMAHYTIVKNTMFNGIRLPSIALYQPTTRKIQLIRRFDYEDYKQRLS